MLRRLCCGMDSTLLRLAGYEQITLKVTHTEAEEQMVSLPPW